MAVEGSDFCEPGAEVFESVRQVEEGSLTPLPTELGHVAGAYLENAAVLLAGLMAQIGHQGDDVLRLQIVEGFFGQYSLGHATGRDGTDRVAENVLLLSLSGDALSESVDAQLGRGIVGLAEVPVKPGRRTGVYNPAEVLLSHEIPGGSGHAERAFEVDLDDKIPVFLSHLLETDISQDARIINNNIHFSESVHGGLHYFVSELHTVIIGHRHSSFGLDLLHYFVRSLQIVVFLLTRVSVQRPS